MKRIYLLIISLLAVSFGLGAQTIVTSDATVGQRAPRLRVAVQGGGVYRFGKLPSDASPDTRAYLKNLKANKDFSEEFLTEIDFIENNKLALTQENLLAHQSNLKSIRVNRYSS